MNISYVFQVGAGVLGHQPGAAVVSGDLRRLHVPHHGTDHGVRMYDVSSVSGGTTARRQLRRRGIDCRVRLVLLVNSGCW